jgi:membrane fusion protein (multidrug efflux system)
LGPEDRHRAAIPSSQNNKEGLERKLATLHTQIAQTNIVSPMAGVVDLVNIKVGEMASRA